MQSVNNNDQEKEVVLKPGSVWLRWEPHIHAPGTLLNDQFDGKDPFEEYLGKIETATPTIKALGVTDYYSLSTYKMVRSAKCSGRLDDCKLIFPNIEMRLSIGTTKGKWVNIHMLVCPDDEDHIEQTERFLSRITFQAYGDKFNCTESELKKLGKTADKTINDSKAALRHGALQFKVSLDNLRETYRDSTWAKNNILFAVAGNQHDGSSGVRDPSDATLRQEIDEFAHIVFSSDPNQREFWLGRKALSPEDIIKRYGALKPCLHGSDAHEHSKVANPDFNRYTWLKGIPSFDTLKQACIDPTTRSFIGEDPPISTLPSQAITQVNIIGASWAKTPNVALNCGLVAIIGARGSGKTALVEIIAAGCDALPDSLPDQSFLVRAQPELEGAKVIMEWGGIKSDPQMRPLNKNHLFHQSTTYPRARYLSQQFVDELCSSEGVGDKLLKEVERVIFEAHNINQKEGTINFNELLELWANGTRANRNRAESHIEILSEQIGVELDKIKLIASLKLQIEEKKNLIAQYTADRNKLVCKGSEKELLRLNQLNEAAEKVRGNVRYFSTQTLSLQTLLDEVNNIRNIQAPQNLRSMQVKHSTTEIKMDHWDAFLMKFSGDVDSLLNKLIDHASKNLNEYRGQAPENINISKSFINEDAKLEDLPLAVLEAEINRLQKIVSTDQAIVKRYEAVSKKITQEIAILNSLQDKLKDYEEAKNRVATLRNERDETYKTVFDALLKEEQVLKNLYAPIMIKLHEMGGTLGKMSFTVQRVAHVERWALAGEALLDLRTGPFKGVGTLCEKASELRKAWETGLSQDVLTAMKNFLQDNQTDLLKSSLVSKDNTSAYKEWAVKFAKWLYGTDHIEIIYSVDYDGVDIRKLSPGTRGIVLLLLYLALDDADDRPLIIDQPEENLDPKSIYDELVGLFIEAKSRRQVIMVTHNANLVVNTDADQIIIASLGNRTDSGMPEIFYQSGGLEEKHIRNEVCSILEGGEIAFKERSRRLRVSLSR